MLVEDSKIFPTSHKASRIGFNCAGLAKFVEGWSADHE